MDRTVDKNKITLASVGICMATSKCSFHKTSYMQIHDQGGENKTTKKGSEKSKPSLVHQMRLYDRRLCSPFCNIYELIFNQR